MSEKSGFLEFMSQVDGFIFHPLTLGLVGFGVFCALLVFAMNNAKTGKSNPLKFSDTVWLNYVYWFAILFAPILAIIFVSILAMLTQVGLRILSGNTMQGEADNLRWYVLSFVGLLTALGGIIGTPLALIRVHTTERQTSTAEQGLITDRINKAVEGLGSNKNVKRPLRDQYGTRIHKEIEQPTQNDASTLGMIRGTSLGWKHAPEKQTRATNEPLYEEITVPNIEVRIGAIYSLERIAQDSPRDHIQIMEILCAYIRGNVPVKSLKPSRPPYIWPKVRQDIQTAINVIGRRSKFQRLQESATSFRLDLRAVDLSGADFQKWNFSAAIFGSSKIEGANFSKANLQGADFSNCMLNYTAFTGADLTGAKLNGAKITDCPPSFTNQLNTEKLFGAMIMGADFSGIQFFGTEKISAMIGSRDTKFGDCILQDSDEIQRVLIMYQNALRRGQLEDAETYLEELVLKKAEHFKEWSPYGVNEMMTQTRLAEFAKKRGLTGWPYWY